MEEIAISEFKAKCLALLDRVYKTKKPIRITRLQNDRRFEATDEERADIKSVLCVPITNQGALIGALLLLSFISAGCAGPAVAQSSVRRDRSPDVSEAALTAVRASSTAFPHLSTMEHFSRS